MIVWVCAVPSAGVHHACKLASTLLIPRALEGYVCKAYMQLVGCWHALRRTGGLQSELAHERTMPAQVPLKDLKHNCQVS